MKLNGKFPRGIWRSTQKNWVWKDVTQKDENEMKLSKWEDTYRWRRLGDR